jgi:peptide-methionine (S)-S-oxide reductase
MWRKAVWLIPVLLAAGVAAVPWFLAQSSVPDTFPAFEPADDDRDPPPPGGTETATFGSGCFWCSEAAFAQMKGVTRVVSGYSGGSVPDPTYEQVCGGSTGHAEVVQVTFDPAVISYPELLEVFWRSHDPTTPNRQGNDTGTQYRSVVFYHSDRQRRQAERYKARIDAAGVFSAPVVTQVVPFEAFYPAEKYHQGYYAANPFQPYCRAVIGPKVDKLRQVFRDKLKPD